MISETLCSRYAIPSVQRPVPKIILDVANNPVPGAGEFFTIPLILRHRDHVSSETFEVAPLDDECDIILPFWWMAKHQPSGLWTGPSHVRFDSDLCKKHCTSAHAPNTFVLSDDKTLIGSEPSPTTGYIGTVNVNPEGDIVLELADQVPLDYHAYLHIFGKKLADELPPHRSFDHVVDLKEGEQPPWGPIYPLSERQLEALRDWLKDMLDTGKIRPSKSPAGAPILFVPKPHGRGLRLCVDYRGLNRVTILNRYALPLMNELRDRVSGAKFFTKIDLKAGYNLVRIRAGDEWKTAFRTRYGHYEFLVMPFGMANAPATFQAMMNEIFRDLLDNGVIVYIDDILIYTETEQEHKTLVLEVLKRLSDENLAVAIDKCEWHKQSTEFLGYIISVDGISMSQDKVKTILEWARPKNLKDVQSFLGFANFYRRFIEGFSRICKPMTDSTRDGGKKFEWTTECEAAFETLKTRFTTAPILCHYDSKLKCVMETDASDFAIGAILSQVSSDGRLHPVAFMSRKMDKAEINYEIHDKEMLAIVAGFKQWRRYLEGASHPIEVFTDHKNLEYFATSRTLNRRQARWAQELAAYDFKIIYRAGSKNGKPDALSRRSEFRPEGGDSDENQPIHTLLRPDQLVTDRSEGGVGRISSARLLAMNRVTFAPAFIKQIAALGQKDPVWIKKFGEATENNGEKHVTLLDGALYYRNRLWIPDDNTLRLSIAENDHDSKIAGHMGQDKTLEMIKRNFYWPNMDDWIIDYVSSCDNCQRNKALKHKRFGFLQPLEVAFAPWQSISMDFITDLPDSEGYVSIWVIVDRFTKMSHFIPLREGEKTSGACARIFVKEIWRAHGLPSDIVSDRDSRFTSQFWQDLHTLLNVKLRMSTAFHPQTDGQTERVNQTVEAYVRAFCCYEQNDWSQMLPMAEFAYNNSVTSATGMSPFYANYGYHPSTNWPVEAEVRNPASKIYSHWLKNVHDFCAASLRQTQERMGKYHDQKAMAAPEFSVGDLVMLNGKNITTRRPTRKFDNRSQGPFRIARVIPGGMACELKLPTSWKIHNTFHVSLLEPYRKSSIPTRAQPDPDERLVDAEPIEAPEEHIYAVESILGSSKDPRTGQVRYLVKWKGFEDKEDWTEEPWENMLSTSVKNMVKDFHRRNPRAEKDSRIVL